MNEADNRRKFIAAGRSKQATLAALIDMLQEYGNPTLRHNTITVTLYPPRTLFMTIAEECARAMSAYRGFYVHIDGDESGAEIEVGLLDNRGRVEFLVFADQVRAWIDGGFDWSASPYSRECYQALCDYAQHRRNGSRWTLKEAADRASVSLSTIRRARKFFLEQELFSDELRPYVE